MDHAQHIIVAHQKALDDIRTAFGNDAAEHIVQYGGIPKANCPIATNTCKTPDHRPFNDAWLTWYDLRVVMHTEGYDDDWFNEALNHTLLMNLKEACHDSECSDCDGSDDSECSDESE